MPQGLDGARWPSDRHTPRCCGERRAPGVTADGEVLVTGAAGGVGSVAIALLARLGYRVVASTGRAAEADYLRALGAAEVIDRATLSAPGKPLQKERWAGVVDAVGSHTLANACAQTKYRGTVAACGLAQGMDFPACCTVHPARVADRRRLGDGAQCKTSGLARLSLELTPHNSSGSPWWASTTRCNSRPLAGKWAASRSTSTVERAGEAPRGVASRCRTGSSPSIRTLTCSRSR